MKVEPEFERLLEVGFVLLAAGMLGGLAVILFGGYRGAGRRRRGEAEPAPHPFVIPAGRHRVHSVAVR